METDAPPADPDRDLTSTVGLMDRTRRTVSLLGLTVAFVLFLASTIFWPDHGMTASSLRAGIAVALVFAAVPIAVLAPTATAGSLVALGGGMTIAGFATTPGGNLLGPIMAATGLLILFTGASNEPAMRPSIVAMMLLCALALSIGIYTIPGATSMWQTLIAVVPALAIAVSTRFVTYRQG